MDLDNDFSQLDYSQLMFRQIDRIQIIATSDSQNPESKLLAFAMSIRLLKGMISKRCKNPLADHQFLEDITDNEKKRKVIMERKKAHKGYSAEENYDNLMELYDICIDLFARRGLLYKNVVTGTQRSR
jgi:hypothetical protein